MQPNISTQKHYIKRQAEKEYADTHHLHLFGCFQDSNSVSYSIKGEPGVQVNVSVRYLSFARKSFFIGLLLLNIMTRSVCGEIKEKCLPLLLFVICDICSWIVTLCCFCLVRMDFLWDPEVLFEIAKKEMAISHN